MHVLLISLSLSGSTAPALADVPLEIGREMLALFDSHARDGRVVLHPADRQYAIEGGASAASSIPG